MRFSFSEPVRGFTQAAIETAQDPACTDEQNNPVFCEPDIGRLETVDDRVVQHYGDAADRSGGAQLHADADGKRRRSEVVGGEQAE